MRHPLSWNAAQAVGAALLALGAFLAFAGRSRRGKARDTRER
ncbi:hypothetical protein [Phenylobacterium sp.]|nr:hypothetical protein [Phenylobacterium sp.]